MISKEDTRRIYGDAGIAIDALLAIREETKDCEAYEGYIQEKLTTVKHVVEFIEAVAK